MLTPRSLKNGNGWDLRVGRTMDLFVVGNAHKDKVKLTFSNGASLPDPDKLFNAGLDGNKWRAIDLYEGDNINERALKEIIRVAAAYNHAKKSTKSSTAKQQG